jgi:cell division topological specificity factor
MGLLNKIKRVFHQEPPKEIAKKRLQLVLQYDRSGLPPNAIEAVKEEILKALEKFPFVDVNGIAINVSHLDGNEKEKIEIEVPVKGE